MILDRTAKGREVAPQKNREMAPQNVKFNRQTKENCSWETSTDDRWLDEVLSNSKRKRSMATTKKVCTKNDGRTRTIQSRPFPYEGWSERKTRRAYIVLARAISLVSVSNAVRSARSKSRLKNRYGQNACK